MNLEAVLHVLGRLCVLLAVLLLAPLGLCLLYGGLGTPVANAFAVSAAMSLLLGWALRLSFVFRQEEFGLGEAFATVTGCWILCTVLGAMPFLITGAIPSLTDAFFEVLSGFSTTGATILADSATLPEPLLFWRAMTHWIGGMGIVALSVAILPALGAGGNFLFQAEAAGPETEKLVPRISSTAKVLWTIYLGLTVAQIAALLVAGTTPLDAVCLTFATVATGGFATRADSLFSYSPAVQWIVTVFMFLAGINFVMLLRASLGRWREVGRDVELRTYTGLVLGAALLCAVVLHQREGAPAGLETLLRHATFTVVTAITCTGFANVDYAVWPVALQMIVLLLVFIGACAGSTGGGLKVIRLVVLWKAGAREILRLLSPRAMFVLKVGGRPVAEDVVAQVMGFLILNLLVTLSATLALLFLGYDVPTSLSAVMTCLSNNGTALGDVGPTTNFAGLSDGATWILTVCMLLGRLEFYSVLVLLTPLAWKR